MPRLIEIVNPNVRRGNPPRTLKRHLGDIITVPVDYNRGAWRVLDMLKDWEKYHLFLLYKKLSDSKESA